MRKEASIPIRLDAETKCRLQQAADALGMTVSALIRLLIKSFVEEYERSNGRLVMPPHWQRLPEYAEAGRERDEHMKAADGGGSYPEG